MRVEHSVLALKAALVALQTMLFSLLIIEFAPFSNFYLKAVPDLSVYAVMVFPLFLLFLLSIYLVLKGMSPAPISLTFLLVHTLTVFTYIVGVDIPMWGTILTTSLLSADLGSRLSMLRVLLPPPQPSGPNETIPAMKVYEQYLRGEMVHPPDAFKVLPHGAIVALVILALSGGIMLFPKIPLFAVLFTAVFIFPSVLALLLLHTREEKGETVASDGAAKPSPGLLARRWSTGER